jgi:mRNA interferase MazF
VVSSDAIGKLPIKLIAPITGWKDQFVNNIWHVRIRPDSVNGLLKVFAVDVLQLRGMDTQRFITKLGRVSSTVPRDDVYLSSIVDQWEDLFEKAQAALQEHTYSILQNKTRDLLIHTVWARLREEMVNIAAD